MLAAHGDWMPLGSADEQKPAADGRSRPWARADDNPVEVEHNARNNRMRAAQ